MAEGKKITSLDSVTDLEATDVFPLVRPTEADPADQNKKVTQETLFEKIAESLESVFDPAGTAAAAVAAHDADAAAHGGDIHEAATAGDGIDVTGQTVSLDIDGLTAKAAPVDADAFPLADSAASDAPKKTLWSAIKSTLKTYFDSLYGDFTGPASSTDGNFVSFDGATGKVGKDSGSNAASFDAAGAATSAVSAHNSDAGAHGGDIHDPATAGEGIALTGQEVSLDLSDLDAKTTPVDGDGFALVDSEDSDANKVTLFSAIKSTLKTYFDSLYEVAGAAASAISSHLSAYAHGNIGKVEVSADDTTAGRLEDKIVAGSNVTVTVLNPGGNEQLEIASTGGGGGGDFVGPASSVDSNFVAFDGVTGKLGKDSGVGAASFDVAGTAASAVSSHDSDAGAHGGNIHVAATAGQGIAVSGQEVSLAIHSLTDKAAVVVDDEFAIYDSEEPDTQKKVTVEVLQNYFDAIYDAIGTAAGLMSTHLSTYAHGDIGKVLMTDGDDEADYLNEKLTAGTNFQITLTDAGGNEGLTLDVLGGVTCTSVATVLNPTELASYNANSYKSCLMMAREVIASNEDRFILYYNDMSPSWTANVPPYTAAGSGGSKWLSVAGTHFYCYSIYCLETINAVQIFSGPSIGAQPTSVLRLADIAAKFYYTEFVGGTSAALDSVPTASITAGDKAVVVKNGVWHYVAKVDCALSERAFYGARGYKIIAPDTINDSKTNLRWVCVGSEDHVNNRSYYGPAYKDNDTARQIWFVKWMDNDNNSWQYEYANTTSTYSFIEFVRTTYLTITLPLVDAIVLNGSGSIRGLAYANTDSWAMVYGQRPIGGRDLCFEYLNVPANTTDEPLNVVGGAVDYELAKRDGSYTGIAVKLSGNVTAGSITVEPTINGTKVSSAALDITITTGNKSGYATVSVSTANLILADGDEIGAVFSTSSDFAPNGGVNLHVSLEPTYDGS